MFIVRFRFVCCASLAIELRATISICADENRAALCGLTKARWSTAKVAQIEFACTCRRKSTCIQTNRKLKALLIRWTLPAIAMHCDSNKASVAQRKRKHNFKLREFCFRLANCKFRAALFLRYKNKRSAKIGHFAVRNELRLIRAQQTRFSLDRALRSWQTRLETSSKGARLSDSLCCKSFASQRLKALFASSKSETKLNNKLESRIKIRLFARLDFGWLQARCSRLGRRAGNWQVSLQVSLQATRSSLWQTLNVSIKARFLRRVDAHKSALLSVVSRTQVAAN